MFNQMGGTTIMINMLYPWIFILLPFPWLIRRFWPQAKQLDQAALKVPFYQQMQQAMRSVEHSSISSRSMLCSVIFYSIWCLLLVAGSGLQWLGQPVQLPRSGRDIMLAIDLSGSMQTQDMKINGQYLSRIAVVKQVAKQFISHRQGDRIGLILFGTHAYLQTPLTFDRQTVQHMLNDATVGIAGTQTAIGDGIGLAIKRLMRYPKQSRAMVLMTDGGNNAGVVTPLAAAKKAAEEGIKIYTIGLGANRMMVNTLFGQREINPSSDLDIDTLKRIAKMTGGKFYRANSGDVLQTIYNTIDQLEPVQADKVTLRPATALYPYPLAIAILIFGLCLLVKSWPRRVT